MCQQHNQSLLLSLNVLLNIKVILNTFPGGDNALVHNHYLPVTYAHQTSVNYTITTAAQLDK